MPYINLFPNYGFPDTGEWYAESGAGDWYKSEYLQRFVDECKGLVLSYDNYSLIGEDGFSDNYWTNLWDVRLASLRNNLPFHTIVLFGNICFERFIPFRSHSLIEHNGFHVVFLTGIQQCRWNKRNGIDSTL